MQVLPFYANFPESQWCLLKLDFYSVRGFIKPLVQSKKDLQKPLVHIENSFQNAAGFDNFSHFSSETFQHLLTSGFQKLFCDCTSGFQQKQQNQYACLQEQLKK
jgi:hypothetical protein